MALPAEEAAVGAAAATPGLSRRAARGFAPRYPAWLTLPSLAWYALFFVGPMAILVAFSMAQEVDFGVYRYALDVSQFRNLDDELYVKVFRQTLSMAAVGTLLTLVVGYPLAYWMARYVTRHKALVLLLVMLPFWTSFLIRTYAWLIILDPDSYLARFVNWTGYSDGWNILFTADAIRIGLVYNYLPLLVLPVYAALERMDWSLVEAAHDLGAGPFRAFREVTLRLTLPGLVTGVLLVFIPMTGEYVIPGILGGGKVQFAGSVIGSQFLEAQDWAFGSAMSLALMGLLSVFVVLYIVVATREEQFGA